MDSTGSADELTFTVLEPEEHEQAWTLMKSLKWEVFTHVHWRILVQMDCATVLAARAAHTGTTKMAAPVYSDCA